MAFKNRDKTALARILTELVKADGLINQNEIGYLDYIYDSLAIGNSEFIQAAAITLQDAVKRISALALKERIAVIRMVEQLSVSDDTLSNEESFILSGLYLSLLPEMTNSLSAEVITVSGFTRNVNGNILYVEGEYHVNVNRLISDCYPEIVNVGRSQGYEFFYLPEIMKGFDQRRGLFHSSLQYLRPDLSTGQILTVGENLNQMTSAFFTREMFLSQIDIPDFTKLKPSFLIPFPDLNESGHMDFLLLEINGDKDPLQLITSFFELQRSIVQQVKHLFHSVDSGELDVYHRRFVARVNPEEEYQGYTGFHRLIIDTLVKHHAGKEQIRLEIDKRGNLFLIKGERLPVRIPALARALYLFYLIHPEGVAFDDLRMHRDEILTIYRHISTYKDEEKLRKAVFALTDYTANTLSSAVSRIRRSFSDLLGRDAYPFLITGGKSDVKKIEFDRHCIIIDSAISVVMHESN